MAKELKLSVNVPGKGGVESPASQLGTRVPAQDFEKLRRQAISTNKLFEDPYFPADNSSLFYSQQLPFTPEWKRPGEIVRKPQLYTGGASRFDVSQGLLGDCWLVAAIASLTQDRILLKRVIPEQDGFDRAYAGIFLFRFWHFGEWVDIVVDDRLPTHNGRLIFIHSEDDNEFWSALLEKAYAKLYGGYEALKGGKTSEAMVDFTGGVVETFDLADSQADELFKKIQENAKRSSMMSCSIRAVTRDDMEAKLSTGLVKGHAYSVTSATTVEVRGKAIKLLRIRNPWGQKEWNGDWSDNSPSWRTVPASKRKELEADSKEDGEFWMSFSDFQKHFTDFEICSVSVDQLYEDDKVKNWNSAIKSGSWLAKNGTSGGCRNYPTFVKNPQYIVDLLEDDDGDGKCSCLIALMQKHRRKQKKMGVQELCIGFSLYKAPPEGEPVLTKHYVDYNYSAGTSGSFTNAREVQKRFDMEPGRYIVIPCSFKPEDEGDFLLRIFTEKSSGSSGASGDGGAATENKALFDKMRPVFDRYAGADGEIDSEELQDMLTMSFSKDLHKSVFSLDACRSMIAMLDEDKNGTLNISEFANLLQTIGIWKKMYFKFDRDRSGSLEKNEAHSAIKSLGYNLSPTAFNILFNRFSTRRKYMKLDDFAACLARVKIMDDTFKRVSKGGSSAQLSQDEFFQITLDA